MKSLQSPIHFPSQCHINFNSSVFACDLELIKSIIFINSVYRRPSQAERILKQGRSRASDIFVPSQLRPRILRRITMLSRAETERKG